MAITISSRKPTSINYKGTTGGNLSWINQAGSAGKGAQKLGASIIDFSSNIKNLAKKADDEMDASRVKQLNNERKANYLGSFNSYQAIHKQGGTNIDEQGVAGSSVGAGNNLSSFIDWDKRWNEENPLPDGNFSSFQVFRQQHIEKKVSSLQTLDRNEKVIEMKSRDEALKLKLVSDINSANTADDVLAQMELSRGLEANPYRDKKDQDAFTILVAKASIRRLAEINAFSGQMNQSVYNSDTYFKAMKYLQIKEDGSYNEIELDKDTRKELVSQYQQSANAHYQTEERDYARAVNKEEDRIGDLYAKGASEVQLMKAISDSSLEGKEKAALMKHYSEKDSKGDSAEFIDLMSKVDSGTIFTQNDLIRNPEVLRKQINELAKGLSIDEKKALNVAIKLKISDAPELELKKKATKFLESIAKSGQQGLWSTSSQTQVYAKMLQLLQLKLYKGYEKGMTMMDMLTPTLEGNINPIYNQLMTSIQTEAMPPSPPVEKEKPGWIDDFMEWYNSDKTE